MKIQNERVKKTIRWFLYGDHRSSSIRLMFIKEYIVAYKRFVESIQRS